MRHLSPRSWLAAGTALLLAAAGMGISTAPALAAPAPDGVNTAEAQADQHQWLTGYWHNFDNGSSVLRVSEIPEAYNLVAIAFADNLAGTPGGDHVQPRIR